LIKGSKTPLLTGFLSLSLSLLSLEGAVERVRLWTAGTGHKDAIEK
jgi:hypothetical protein